MVNRNLIRGLDIDEDQWVAVLDEAMAGADPAEIDWGGQDIAANQIVTGKVVRVDPEFVVVDVGYKSEGAIPTNEWEEGEERPAVGDDIKVLIEDVEDQGRDDARGMLILSKRKAEKIEAWLKVMETVHENDVVTGTVTRKIKGGLLVDIGVNVFLPASQVDIRRPADIGDYIGRTIQCIVLKIDEARRNIVVSRRALIEAERAEKKTQLLTTLEIGQHRKGVVKNIAEFGAFVDLGGIDGLLHITDMSWGRIGHPSEMVHIDEELEVVILHIDREREKIALGLKQKQPSPWEQVEGKYPVGKVVRGTVRNLTNYGAFIEIEEGIDGLLHVSDMSWTRKISHPSELLEKGQKIRCKVISVDQQRRRIALGLKQLDEDPWARDIPGKYQPGQVVTGTVTKITNFGVFVGLEDGLEGLLHISELADHKVESPEDVVKLGDSIEVKILRVDTDDRKIGLSRKRVDWSSEAEAAQPAAKPDKAAAPGRASSPELKGGIGGGSGPLFKTGGDSSES